LSFDTACHLAFRGSLDEWERLMGLSRVGDRSADDGMAPDLIGLRAFTIASVPPFRRHFLVWSRK
jgi:hypothetical protein